MKINITIKPNSTKGPLIKTLIDGSLIVYTREIAADNQANQALIKLLAKHFKLSKSSITILHGHTTRHKIVEVNFD